MDIFAHGMSHPFKGPGAAVNGFISKKWIGEISLHFQLQLKTRWL